MTSPADNTILSLPMVAEVDIIRAALASDYELYEELGRGGMAMVFRAIEKALDREVAIKILPGRLLLDTQFVERFENEARTAARLEHPNIVPIYRVGRAGPNAEVIYFVMKLLRGQSLSAVLRERQTLDVDDVRRIILEVASAIGYASKRGVVHRDIKPDNILLDSEGRCVVTDFGIAKTPSGAKTAEGTSLGTPRYMSPEHATGQPLDGRSDLYSLGVVAYICLFGKPPFDADEPFAVLYKHIHEPLPEPTMPSEAHRQLYAIIARMLAKKPDDRFQTADELIQALGGHISAPTLVPTIRTSAGMMAPTEVMPTPRPWHISRWRMLPVRRQRMWMATGALAGAAAIALLIIDLTPTAPAATTPNRSAPRTQSQGGNVVPTDPAGVAPIVSTPAPLPKPKPSARAEAIMLANRAKSGCPKIDTLPNTKPIARAVIVDSIPDFVRRDSTLLIRYSVCGLPPNAPFTADIVVGRYDGGKLGTSIGRYRQDYRQIESAIHTRSPESYRVALPSDGRYFVQVTVQPKTGESLRHSRDFRVTDK